MIKIFFLLTVFFMPLFAAQDDPVLEKFNTISSSDLEEVGFGFDEANEILKLAEAAQNFDIPVASNDVPRVPAWDVALPAEWECFYETESRRPLIICPRDEEAVHSFHQVALENQAAIIATIKKHGAVVFSGFGFTLEEFPVVFKAATGVSASEYEGDTPREQVAENVYRSTAVGPAYHIGLHQEEAACGVERMCQYLGFYCQVPPAPGTGRTLAASAKEITRSIQETAPDLWELINQKLIPWAFYMPDAGFWSRVTKMLNSSHATVTEKFGTNDPEIIRKWCEKKGYQCLFVDGGVKLIHQPVLGVTWLDGELTFCNQIHLAVRNAHLCGGAANKAIADALLYEQYGLLLPDGTSITADQADRLWRVIKPHEDGRDWKAGDVMIFDNLRALHGKTPHRGERKVYTVMGGRAEHSA